MAPRDDQANEALLQRTHFFVQSRRHDHRPLYVLGIEVAEGRWRQWLLPRQPPLKHGVRRIAIDRPDLLADVPKGEAWDVGPCTIEATADDLWVIQFGGRQLFGHYVLSQARPAHWLLFQGRERPKQPVQFALSAGGIVMRGDAEAPEVVLVRPRGRRYWTLPKGTVEPDEDLPDTALREVEEETGVQARIVQELDPIDYWFWSNDEGHKVRIHKAVAYYLMTAEAEGEHTATREIAEVAWVPLAEARDRVTHRSERDVLGQGAGAWQGLGTEQRTGG